jgi:hypothetical protein
MIPLPVKISNSDLFDAIKLALQQVAGITIAADGSIADSSGNGIRLTVGGAVYDLADGNALVADFAGQYLISRGDPTKTIQWTNGDLEFSDPSIGPILLSRPSKNRFRLIVDDSGNLSTEPA